MVLYKTIHSGSLLDKEPDYIRCCAALTLQTKKGQVFILTREELRGNIL